MIYYLQKNIISKLLTKLDKGIEGICGRYMGLFIEVDGIIGGTTFKIYAIIVIFV
jgi:hypothetical protein